MNAIASPMYSAWLAKVVARTALAVVWVYEGLVPKLLWQTPHELELLARTGVAWPTPSLAMGALGVVEVLAGIWLLTGRAERLAAGISTAVLLALGPVIAVMDPAVLYHPYGGFSKNFGLIACGVAVMLLARAAPRRVPCPPTMTCNVWPTT